MNYTCKTHNILIPNGGVCPRGVEIQKIKASYQAGLDFTFWLGVICGGTAGAIIGFLVGLMLW